MAERVAVIGAGQMGNGIAHVFAQSGFDVDDDRRVGRRARARARHDRGEPRSSDQEGNAPGRRQGRDPRPHRHRRSRSPRSTGASLVVEAATENRDLKFKIFSELDALADTGRDPRHEHQLDLDHRDRARTKRPEHVIGMHFMNPVPVMQLVEVIRGLATSDATTTARARAEQGASARRRSRCRTIRASSRTGS